MLRIVRLTGAAIILVSLCINSGAALYFVVDASANAADNPILLLATVCITLALAIGWGGLVLVIVLLKKGWSERRRFKRYGINRPGTIWLGEHRVESTVINLSAGGALLEAPPDNPSQGRVMVDLPGIGRCAADIVRVGSERLGIKFLERQVVDLKKIGAVGD